MDTLWNVRFFKKGAIAPVFRSWALYNVLYVLRDDPCRGCPYLSNRPDTNGGGHCESGLWRDAWEGMGLRGGGGTSVETAEPEMIERMGNNWRIGGICGRRDMGDARLERCDPSSRRAGAVHG